jgi:hypothetical protein
VDSRVEGDEVSGARRGVKRSGDDLKRPVHGRVRRQIGGGEDSGEESGEGEALTQLYPQPGA